MNTAIFRSEETKHYERHVTETSFTTWRTGRISATSLTTPLFLMMIFFVMANLTPVQTSTTTEETNSSVQTSTTQGATNSSVQPSTTPGATNSSVQTFITTEEANSFVHISTTIGGTKPATNTDFLSITSSPSFLSSTSPAYGNTRYDSHKRNGDTIMISNCKKPNIAGGIALSSNAGRTIVISCFSGFSLQGTNTLRCVDESWDAPIPTCFRQSYSSSDVHSQINNTATPEWFLWTLCVVFGLLGLLILCCVLYICLRICGCLPDRTLGQVHPSELPTRRLCCACCRIRVDNDSDQTLHAIDSVGDSDSRQSLHQTGSPETNRKLVIQCNKKQTAKSVLTWMPHRYPVRNINTSTK